MKRVPLRAAVATTAVAVAACAAMSGALAWRHPADGPPSGGRPAVARRAGFAMGTFVQIVATGPGAEEAAEAALAEVKRLDRLFDRFDPASPVAKVNAAAGRGKVGVPPEVAEAVELALFIARQTGGAFDPTVGPLVDVWGFGESFERARPSRPPEPGAIEAARRLVGYTDVEVDQQGATTRVGLAREGMVLDLGGIAQGYAADRAIRVLRERGVRHALVDVGGEVAALGSRPTSGRDVAGPQEGWRVGIQHPRDGRRLLATLRLVDRAAATSGDYERYFEYGGKRFCHLINPLTGYPARGLVAATVLHPSAAVADALATAVMVLGPEQGEALIRRWPDAEAILVDEHLRVLRVKGR